MIPSAAKLARRTKLSLNNAHLPAFPEQLIAATKLRSLDGFRMIASDGDPTIPTAIGKLVSLEQLTLGGNSFRELPAAIGKLSKLQTLELDHCSELRVLPKAIGKLTQLRMLRLRYAEQLVALPSEIGGLSKLETLYLDDSGVVTIPPALWKCTKLRSLELPKGVEKLPRGIGKLRELERLRISPAALFSIADELPKLESLERLCMGVSGTTRSLPETLGLIPNLKELHLTYLELESLPESLVGHARLELLDVMFNKLETLLDLVRSLPKLNELGCDHNPLSLAEKRQIRELMKLPPSKRRKAKLALAPKAKAKAKVAIQSLGTVASINAYLAMLIVDAKLGKSWTGIGEGSEPGGDWQRASEALDKRGVAWLEVGDGSGAVVVLGVWQGVAQVFRVGERLTFAEVFCDDDDDPRFREWIASEPSEQARAVANIWIRSGKLAMLPTTNTIDDDEGLTTTLGKGVWSLLLEPATEDAWGQGRRGHLIPA